MEAGKTAEKRDATLGSRRNRAAPVGMTVKTKIEGGDRYSAPEIYNLEITVLEVLRGKGAWDRIRAAGVFDPALKAGFENILARIKFGYFSKGRGFGHEKEPYEIEEDYFATVSADGKTEYAIPSVTRQPQPQLINIPFTSGDVKEGWIALQVPEGERGAFLIFKREYRENAYGFWGPVWFKL